MNWILLILAAVALLAGIWVGLGHPGWKGREDRIVGTGRPQRLERKRLDWLRPPERDRNRHRR
jgi:hypothetical protein